MSKRRGFYRSSTVHKVFSVSVGRLGLSFVALLTCVLLCGLLVPAVVRAENVGVKAERVAPAGGLNLLNQVGEARPAQAESGGAVARPGEVIVQFGATMQTSAMRQSVASAGVTVERLRAAKSPRSLSYALCSSKTLSTEALVARFKGMPGVVAVSPNYVRTVAAVPNDPEYGELWGMENTGQVLGTVDADIDALTAWNYTTGSSDVVIANIDTGVDYTHEDLAANMWENPGEIAGDGIDNDGNGYIDDIYGIDAYDGDSDPMDEDGHGTHTSGTIAAVGNNGVGVAGVAWQAKIMALRFLGPGGGWDDDAIECIIYAVEMKMNRGVNIVAINASWGGSGFNPVLMNAIQIAGNAGIVFCAAAGNAGGDNDSVPYYPASYNCSNIISVGASDSYDSPASFSNYGATSVDLFAPGVSILSTISPELNPTYTPAAGDTFFDDMESGSGNWTTTGTWAITEEWTGCPSPPNSFSDSPSGNYVEDTYYDLTTKTLDLSSLASSGAALGFSCKGELEDDFDFLDIYVSGDGGASWDAIGYFTGPIPAGCYWGYLPPDVLTDKFQLRFELYSDVTNTYDGVYIDDVGIGVPVPGEPYVAWPGTSMATPHVTGTIALLATVAPSDSVATRIGRVLSKVDHPAALSGLCVTGGRLNAGAAVASCVPTITSVSPASGLSTGGNSVIINGTGFTAGSVVKFGGTTATSRTVDSAIMITAVAPARAAGTVDVTVTTPGGTSSVSGTGNDYTYLTRYEETSTKLGYSGTWTSGAGSAYSGGSYKKGSAAGSTVVVKFTGSSLAWIATKASSMGIARVSLDYGTPVEVDLYKSSTAYKQKVWQTSASLATGSHTVIIEWTGKKKAASSGTTINADAFDLLGTLSQAPVRYQENNAKILYSSGWTPAPTASASAGNYRYASAVNNKVTVKFTGTSIAWIGVKGANCGKARITLDGVDKGIIDLYSATTKWGVKLWSATVASGKHTLVITCTGTKQAASTGTRISIDAFDVLGKLY